jgi:hypothetical protein
MSGPCLCGDYCCPSCGPAQGNWKCPICNRWASEGCPHIGVRTGKLLKRYEKQAERIEEAEAARWEKYASEAV